MSKTTPDRALARSRPARHTGNSNRASFGKLLLHVHPRSLPESTLGLSHTWGLGGAAFVLVLLQVLTGTLLLFVYQPVPEKAYHSVSVLINQVMFGRFIRNMHYVSANLLVAVVLLHMLRVFFTDAFRMSRRFNWIIGLFLFGCVLVSNFTGYLLPWDQLAYWAVTICTGMMDYVPLVGGALQNIIRGGPDMGPATLSNFFVFHVIVMPLCFLVLLPFHFWRVRKAGGVVLPRGASQGQLSNDNKVPVMPDLVIREAALTMVVLAIVFMGAALFDAPLGDSANPGLSPNPTKAPWYFTGFQELMLHFHPVIAVVIIPLTLMGLLCGLPYLRYDADMSGIWFRSGKGRRTALAAALSALILTPVAVIADEFLPGLGAWLGLPGIAGKGLLPFVFVMTAFFCGYLVLRKKYTDTNNEAVQGLFVFLLTAFIVLTVFGIGFRGEGMALCW